MKSIRIFLKSNYQIALVLILGLVSFWGALVYLVYQLNWLGTILSLFLALFSFVFIIRYLSRQKQVVPELEGGRPRVGISILYLVLAAVFLGLVIQARTGRALVSPFEVLPHYILPLYLLLIILLFYLCLAKAKYSFIMVTVQFFLSLIVLPIVYSAGYGYDPFLHQAALKTIDQFGVILPKTVYYLGQYSLEIITHRLVAIDFRWLDNFLLPVLAVVSIPLIAYRVLPSRNKAWLLLWLLLWPLAFLTYTTPQNLAYLFVLLIVLLSLLESDKLAWSVMLVLALAALLTQPLAGIPALVFVMALRLKSTKYYWLLFGGQAIFWPLFFYFFLPTKLAWPQLGINFSGANLGDWFSNLIYFWHNFRPLIIIFTLIIFVLLVTKKKLAALPHLFSALSLLLSFGFCLFLPATNLAITEQYDYTIRLLTVGLIFMIPAWLYIGLAVKEFLIREKMGLKIIILLVLSLFVTASFYLNYPRQDIHFNSHGYSVSVFDLHAVQFIHDVGKNQNYVVLANQQVGAAAISQYGFYKYYGPNFYYSTQSGGQLQDFFQKLMVEPKKETVLAAMDLVGVNRVYVVVNNYWWDFERVTNLLKHEASGFVKIDNGEDYVFWFSR